MEDNKEEMIDMVGEEKYFEEIEVIEKMIEKEEEKGVFCAKEGDVDCRAWLLKDIALPDGF